ncbi:MAG: protein-L-isoaspartate(D-aspartate) O-methyltransferase [Cellvibrionaceae bacterium]|nr:protein-L-isoaspartate(D-aspartate) O-methyltransferase [Cellvibrionaceae bacterium]
MTSERTRERMIQRLLDQGISNQRVLTAMRQTPRHLFLDEALAHRAYEDTALPIGFRQTLSQPYIVAKMTECLLEAAPRLDKVLEIGTGSGYQAAVLAPLVTQLFSVERIQPLQEKARERLYQLKRHNVKLRLADGHLGLPAHAPYDAILSAAAPSSIPDALKQQLAPDGVLIIPVGEQSQQMTLLKRIGQTAEYQQQIVENVRFVPLLNGVVR